VPLYEVKRVADFVNLKICRAALGVPARQNEAFDFFRRHVRLFKALVLPPMPTREGEGAAAALASHVHCGWLAKQYRAFAKILEALGALPAGSDGVRSSYAEPGYYYQAAATCMLERRQNAEKVLAAGGKEALALMTIEKRPWKKVASELGVSAEVNASADSAAVIELLTRAYEHVKPTKRSRAIFFLAWQMAQEHLHSENYEMAKRFYERICKQYQKERWWFALAQIMRSLRECALQLRLLPDFVDTSISLLSSKLSTPTEAESILLELLSLVRRAAPLPLPFPPLSSHMLIELSQAQQLISASVEWSSAQLPLGATATLSIRLISCLAVSLTASSFQIVSSDAELARCITSVPGSEGELLTLAAGGSLKLEIAFTARAQGTVAVQQLLLHLGEGPCAMHLALPLNQTTRDVVEQSEAPAPTLALTLTAPPPVMTLELIHESPLLLHEVAALVLLVRTNGDSCYDGRPTVRVSYAVAEEHNTHDISKEALPVSAAAATPLLLDASAAALSGLPPLPTLPANSEHRVLLYVRASALGSLEIAASLAYAATADALPQAVSCRATVEVVPAVELTTSLLLSPEQKVRHDLGANGAQLLVHCRCVAPGGVRVQLLSIELQPRVNEEGTPLLTLLGQREHNSPDAELTTGGQHSALFKFAPSAVGREQHLGVAVAKWRRLAEQPSSQSAPAAEVTCELPRVNVTEDDFAMWLDPPTEGTVGQLLTLKLRAQNRTSKVHTLLLKFCENDAFLFCGYKLLNFSLPPAFAQTVTFSLIPIQAGAVLLPPVRLKCASTGRELFASQAKHVVFVSPSGANNEPPCTQSA